ncbi:glutathione S-transferase family protein [Roseobacter sp. HKCCD9010]|uniref:glutathione S-transferase family protein n=1 Tax=unclassified Roseobacter TaxID=196798 RepID=UPI00149242BB|nr:MULTISPECIES: glutathione S-transferase family protein [unclassified Roseobacter]MBF9049575.1 glutathione S-transferase family protein [Rhodobacterales bacterium HKCCD4356]NNV11575.1 glutathione S-transferase family protein [Roseobacter sp. HKCCD7357]NNV15759.1 glutathione S-transferase family protein [Roseobacter sp. HKCCD8768]NNV25219.1 glutathione S-transferase family protein [Roseobacter sp. HKCCD8192]NNV29476.1 glutathione S-transferase family protein [Roseobacter sp. HKCCD9061]
MIKIVSFKICPFVQRVTALLEAKGVPYDIEFIDLSDKPQWFLDMSPTGQVPMLITDDGDALFESDAIVEYIEEVTPPLVPEVTPVQRAKDRAWSYQASKHYLVQCSTMQSKDQTVLAEREAKLTKAFEKAEKQLGKGPFFNGDILGNVDIAWLPLLHRAQIVREHSGYDFLADYPKIRAWQSALADTGLYAKSVADDFQETFSDFYLADRTFLGRGADFSEPVPEVPQGNTASCCG